MPTIHDRAVTACRLSVITCVDFRIHRELRGIVPEPADILTLPGAAHCIVRVPTRRAILFEELSLVVDAHGAEKVLLYSHTDCAKYGGMEAFPNPDAEGKALWRDLEEARRIVVAHPPFRNLEVVIGVIKTGTSEVWQF